MSLNSGTVKSQTPPPCLGFFGWVNVAGGKKIPRSRNYNSCIFNVTNALEMPGASILFQLHFRAVGGIVQKPASFLMPEFLKQVPIHPALWVLAINSWDTKWMSKEYKNLKSSLYVYVCLKDRRKCQMQLVDILGHRRNCWCNELVGWISLPTHQAMQTYPLPIRVSRKFGVVY